MVRAAKNMGLKRLRREPSFETTATQLREAVALGERIEERCVRALRREDYARADELAARLTEIEAAMEPLRLRLGVMLRESALGARK